VKVTVAPATGLPSASSTFTCSGFGYSSATLAERLRGVVVMSLAGTPAMVFVSENDTEPYCETAVTV
jgi:hypothetical protein